MDVHGIDNVNSFPADYGKFFLITSVDRSNLMILITYMHGSHLLYIFRKWKIPLPCQKWLIMENLIDDRCDRRFHWIIH